MPLFIPEDYTAKLAPETMEQAITYLKEIFPDMLARRLRLRRVTAPLFVLSGTGINDDLNGVERAVSFPIRDLGDRRAEVVHSLAKWKRMKLGTYKIAPGYGLYTDMNAIRADEELDNIHSLYVDQWDWERTMRPEERNLNFLKATVETIYEAMKAVEEEVYELYPHITPILPERITFLQAEELLQEFPALTPKEREQAAARKYGALFLIGIGGELSDGQRHDGRAPDYDDWSTDRRRLQRAQRRHHRVEPGAGERLRTFEHGHPRRRRGPRTPACDLRMSRAARNGVPPPAARRTAAALDRRRHRPVAPLHVLPALRPYRRSPGQHLARADDRRVRRPRHPPQVRRPLESAPAPRRKPTAPRKRSGCSGLRKSPRSRSGGFAYFPAAGWSGVWPFLFLL